MKPILFYLMSGDEHFQAALPILSSLKTVSKRVFVFTVGTFSLQAKKTLHGLGIPFFELGQPSHQRNADSSKKVPEPHHDQFDESEFLHQNFFHLAYPIDLARLYKNSYYYKRFRALYQELECHIQSHTDAIIICQHGSEPFCKRIVWLAQKFKLPLLLWESSFLPGKILLDSQGMHFFPEANYLSSHWQAYPADPIPQEQKQQIRNFLTTWKTGMLSKYDQHSATTQLALLDKIKKRAKRVVFFAGQVPWDANILTSLDLFIRYDELVNFALEKIPEDWEVIYKPHPKAPPSRIEKRQNLHVLHQISIHDAFRICDVVMTISSNVGLESIMYGKPVICLGRPHYSHKGFTLDWDQKTSFSDLLENSVYFKPDQENIDKYLSLVFFKYLIDPEDHKSIHTRVSEANPPSEKLIRSIKNSVPKAAKVYEEAIKDLNKCNPSMLAAVFRIIRLKTSLKSKHPEFSTKYFWPKLLLHYLKSSTHK